MKRKKKVKEADAAAVDATDIDKTEQEPPDLPAEPSVDGASVDGAPGAAVIEPPEEAIHRLKGEVDEQRDRYLRVAAEFDNFRKRVTKERSATWSRAQADVVSTILDSLDDLGRVAGLDPEQTSAADVIAGVELVERKILRELESAGLHRVGEEGERFDPNDHEAVGTLPAPSDDHDHLIAAVLQPGYRFGGALLRPARVQVYVVIESPDGDGS